MTRTVRVIAHAIHGDCVCGSCGAVSDGIGIPKIATDFIVAVSAGTFRDLGLYRHYGDNLRPIFKYLWLGRCGFGFVWKGTEHQFYRDCDGSMGKPWTHDSFPWGDADAKYGDWRDDPGNYGE